MPRLLNKSALPFCLFWTLLFFSAPHAFAAEDPQFVQARQQMVKRDLKGRDISDPRVLRAMVRVPRHLFVDPDLTKKAYEDRPLPIGQGQTISQPYVVALMIQTLRVKPGDRVLEVGTGSGYAAAVLAEITDQVYTIEIVDSLAKEAAGRLKELGYNTVQVKSGDGYKGWEEAAPFEGILVSAAAGHIPPALVSQLKEGGRLVMPVGNAIYGQTLTLVTKKDGNIEVRPLIGVAFVPMTGEAQKK